MKNRISIFVVLFALMGGCVSDAESEIDTLPDLYDGERFIGRIMGYASDSEIITVWIPHLKSIAFYRVISSISAELSSKSIIRPWFSSLDCTGIPYAITVFPCSLIVAIPKEGGGIDGKSYFLDKEISRVGVELKSWRYLSGECHLQEEDTTNIDIVELQPSDIPVVIRDSLRIY